MKQYIKNCPVCGEKQYFKTKWTLQRSIDNNKMCRTCFRKNPTYLKKISEATKGIKNGMYGKHHSLKSIKLIKEKRAKQIQSIEQIEKFSMWWKGKQLTNECKEKMRLVKLGKKNPFYGKTHTEETKRKIRLKVIDSIKNRVGSISPSYNPNACLLIEEYGKKNGYDFQHAENGGEFYIKELGYWVDGYDKDKNVVIEVDESYHKRYNQKQKDIIRQNNIIKKLNCKFIRIDEQTKETYEIN